MRDRPWGRTENRSPPVARGKVQACASTRPETLALPFSLEAPASSRAFVQEVLCTQHGGAALVAVQLLASEMVTDAVLRGAPPVRLTLTCQVSEILVSVDDADPVAAPTPGGTLDPPADEETLRGTDVWREGIDTLRDALLDKVAREHGVDTTPAGRVQWCTVPTGYIPRPRSHLWSDPDGPAGASASSDA